ncbi:hypothetical protein KIN20_006139 [Parelaphostrongylus tenuis]|uniref:Uncharacterized protein n=1 Tax=Parelaphostrongylus tenuis TaxID=148309 RepID=A0AAD5QJ49_PARTN|nr:hypothetical protein KIN20_006139 [Parelaphostrongylus tenuis]
MALERQSIKEGLHTVVNTCVYDCVRQNQINAEAMMKHSTENSYKSQSVILLLRTVRPPG